MKTNLACVTLAKVTLFLFSRKNDVKSWGFSVTSLNRNYQSWPTRMQLVLDSMSKNLGHSTKADKL